MSAYDDLLAQQKRIQEQLNALSQDDIRNAEREKVKNDMQADIDTFSTGMDSQISNTQNYYGKLEDDTKTAYESQYERNAVQKLVNEKQSAERNANLGLTDSGLNRTQQTAAQLSYANQKGDIDLARQSKLDELSLELASAVTELQNEKASGIREITSNWNSYADTRAENIYNTQYEGLVNQYNDIGDQITKIIESENDAAAEVQKKAIEAEAALQKALISASGKTGNVQDDTTQQKIYWFRGVSNENDNYLYYNTETGKTEEIPPYTNPYNSQDNRIAYSAEYNDKNIGFFQLASGKTGYQPRGLVSEGGKFSAATCDGMIVKYDLYGNGKENTIWKSKTNKYFIWDDINNRYLDLTEEIKALFPNIQ